MFVEFFGLDGKLPAQPEVLWVDLGWIGRIDKGCHFVLQPLLLLDVAKG